MTFESYIKARLLNYVFLEAFASGGTEPMLAVAQVLKNRVDAGWNGGDWLRVLDDAPQKRGTEPPFGHIDPHDPNFRALMSRIDDVYYGTADDSNVNNGSGKAMYYAELHNLNRPWFQDHILDDLESHPRLASVGQLTFFG
jgi:hypothetical protein